MHKHEIILTDDDFAELEIEAELLGKKYVEALHEQKARQGRYILVDIEDDKSKTE